MFRWAVLLTVTLSFSAAALASSMDERPFANNFPMFVPWIEPASNPGNPVYRGQCTTPEHSYFCAFQSLKYG